jgi:hypothetical protein
MIASLFGPVTLLRYLYQPVESSGRCLFPLALRLGLEAGLATPALASRIAVQTARHPQEVVRQWLASDQGVEISVSTLRKVVASVAAGTAAHRHATQVARVLEWLRLAHASKRNRKPVLAAGRDGVFLPIRTQACYREAATATVTVYDRAGKRLGTVYLASMPEFQQATLSAELTHLLADVLQAWKLALPRLVYLTDGGSHSEDYYRDVLAKMVHPHRPEEYPVWERVIDFYHASQYVTQLGQVLFGTTAAAASWSRKMHHWLKHKPNGIYRVLHSAAAMKTVHGLQGSEKDYDAAYAYLRRRIPCLNYAEYRRLRTPIGSGITEAACKTVFTQRFKLSGMTWSLEGGAAILPLRVIYLSGTWTPTFTAYLRSQPLPHPPGQAHVKHSTPQIAA